MKPAGRPGATWEGQLGAPRGTETERQTERQNGAFLVFGGTIGHRPLYRAAAQKMAQGQ